MIRIARTFRWEAAHRLPFVEGECSNLHGHSYRMQVELAGNPGGRGWLMDFKQLKALVMPLVDHWDHATLVAESDHELLSLLKQTRWKIALLPFDSTCENLGRFVADALIARHGDALRAADVSVVRVRISETEQTWAEVEQSL